MSVGSAASRRSGWFVLRYPRRVAFAGWVSTGLLVGAIVAAAVAAEPDERPLILACLAFSPATALLVVQAHWVRHGIGPTGLGYRGLLRAYPHVAWETLVRVQWSDWMKRLTLVTQDGKVLHFSILLEGIDELARSLAEHAPHIRADTSTAAMLAAARSDGASLRQ